MNILVTGGAGFIGSHIVDLLIAADHEVAIVDNLWQEGGGRKEHIHPAAAFYQADITDEPALRQIFDRVRPEIVYHQAAQHSVAISARDPLLDARVNVLGLLNVLNNCTRTHTRKIICASSGASYGTCEQMPINEQTPQRPQSPYGITKMAMEQYLRYWQQANGLTYTALRYGNVFGPRQDPGGEAGVIAIFARRFLLRQSVHIYWDGEQQKDYVYVGDVARANLLALDRGDNEIFCIGTGQGTSVNAIYETLAALTGYRPEIMRAPRRSGDIYLSYFDCSKAARELGWRPEVDFVEGTGKTLAFIEKNE
jgi:UDP-glucose 4-epimerase